MAEDAIAAAVAAALRVLGMLRDALPLLGPAATQARTGVVDGF